MELKEFRDTISVYAGRWETKLELPVETEIMIPDYLPAVFKIVKCLISPVLMQNQISESHWKGEGYLRCTVYYQSDETGSCLCRTEQKFPFEKTVELPAGQTAAGAAAWSGEVEYSNCRAVSEHRIELRGAYLLNLSAPYQTEKEVLTSLADCGIEQRTEALHGCLCLACEEKTYTASGTIQLPGAGKPFWMPEAMRNFRALRCAKAVWMRPVHCICRCAIVRLPAAISLGEQRT